MIGQIISGSFSKGLELKLINSCDIENIKIGEFVIIEGNKTRFFAMITDIKLGTSNEKLFAIMPDKQDNFIKDVLSGTFVYGIVHLTPYLMLEENKLQNPDGSIPKVKKIPPHFSSVKKAEEKDIEQIFGKDKPTNSNFYIGTPTEMNIPICINLDRFVERSNAVFGKSGTGKSFLSRILLAGILKKDIASLLIFDMHNEYGWQGTSESKEGTKSVKGLKQLFNDKMQVFTLDPENKTYTFKDAQDLEIAYNQIDIEDLELIRDELSLTDPMLDHARLIRSIHGNSWFKTIHEMTIGEIQEFCIQNNAHIASLAGLQRRLQNLTDSVKYLKPVTSYNGIKKILDFLLAGKSVALQFGRQNNIKSYLLASNIITRYIHEAYRDITEKYLIDPVKNPKPRKLVICIEEAHKFLSPQISKSGTFGTIARELRKYNVTLFIIDQRPSGIDSEVLSQIGTRATLLLNDENDINAVFIGESGSEDLKKILAGLNSTQEVLLFGYAMPMPIVIRTRRYDSEFYKTMSQDEGLTKEEIIRRGERAAAEL